MVMSSLGISHTLFVVGTWNTAVEYTSSNSDLSILVYDETQHKFALQSSESNNTCDKEIFRLDLPFGSIRYILHFTLSCIYLLRVTDDPESEMERSNKDDLVSSLFEDEVSPSG